jgi:putative DNA primase/helicase
METPKLPFHQTVAEKLVAQLKEGTAPWQKPWRAGDPGAFLPLNPTTGKRYKGINAIHLMSQGFDDQRWMTYKQAEAAGAQVRKGEKGTSIQYWKFSEEQDVRDAAGNPVRDAAGDVRSQPVPLERPRVFFATVFNTQQIEGMPPIEARRQQAWEAHELADSILRASGAAIHHGEANRAFYRPATDSIHLPDKEQFETADRYYATALHELGHWTGHSTRLARDLAHPFGSEGYAREELRAEIASMILGDELGVGHDPMQHVAYVGSWIKALQDDPFEIFRAAADAEKIQGYVLGLSQQAEHSISMNQDGALTADSAAFATPDRQRQILTGESEMKIEKGEVLINADLNTSPHIEAAAETSTLVDTSSQEMAGPAPQSTRSRTLIDVPFTEKDEAKELGAKWDRRAQSWYIPAGADPERFFAKWPAADSIPGEPRANSLGEDVPIAVASSDEGRTYLAVPYADRNAAKAAGAVWDRLAKSWYEGENADRKLLAKWMPENLAVEQAPAMPPREEFTETLKSFGCIVSGEHPIMDGKKHRISVYGEKFNEHSGSGFYVAHLDGHPAGYIKNNKTGIEGRWKSKGYSLTPEQKAEMNSTAAQKLSQREAALVRKQELAARRAALQRADLVPAVHPTPYMVAKGIASYSSALTDGQGLTTYVPATDVTGKQWTTQYINEDGVKRFAKDSRKEGCFHVVDGLEKLATASMMVICEGYATAVSLSQALGLPAVAAFDSGNLLPVAQALHAKFPEKPIVIAGDDDRHLEITLGHNPGRTKAEQAAHAVGGKVLMPIFAPGENSYPAALGSVSREQYREHHRSGVGVSDEQLAALAHMKQYTDFNDLANKSVLGIEGMKRQVAALTKSIGKGQRPTVEEGHDVEDSPRPRQRRAKKLA